MRSACRFTSEGEDHHSTTEAPRGAFLVMAQPLLYNLSSTLLIAQMPRDYLKKIEHATFPLRVDDQYEVRCVYVLQAAELVEVDVVQAATKQAGEVVMVRRITPMGKAEIDRIKRSLE